MAKITSECERFLKGFWDDDELRGGLQDPIKFVRDTINPFLKDLQKKGKNVPTVYLSGSPEDPLIKLSTEQ